MKQEKESFGKGIRYKGRQRSFAIFMTILLAIVLTTSSASASPTGSFNIGAYWQPPTAGPAYSTDMNTNANWLAIKNANIDTVMAIESESLMTKAKNESGINFSNANNVTLMATDAAIYGKETFTSADITALNNAILPYKNDARVKGLNLKDEPAGWNLEGYANTYKQAKLFAPNLSYYVNLLAYKSERSEGDFLGAPSGKLFLSNSAARGSGTFVTAQQPLGQTFKMPAGVSFLRSMQFYLDAVQWSSNEMLSLKIWDSPAKTAKLAQADVWGYASATTNQQYKYYPIFTLDVQLTANTTYYWELTHNGGGDNSVGWVTSSPTGTSTNADGTAYVNGVAKNYDFYYKLYTRRPNTPDIKVNPPLGSGDYVRSTQSFGQTFTTPANVNRFLYYIQPYIDPVLWNGQALTITLWDSPSKTNKIAVSKTLTSSNSGHTPIFYIAAKLNSNTSYYWELTSNSGSNVGWIVYSSSSAYAGGTAYKNGVQQANSDMWFNARFGSEYENYVDDWVDYSGADFIQFDNYPFLGGPSDDVNYFLNIELIRDRAIDKNVKYGAFLQSVGITDSNTGAVRYRNPTLNEKRYNVYTHLAYGFKNMYWFTYWRPQTNGWGEVFNGSPVDFNGTQTAAYSHIQTLNGEMKNLGATLKDLTSQAVYHTGLNKPRGTTGIPAGFFIRPQDMNETTVTGYFTDASGRKYIMLVNREYNFVKTNIPFNLNPKPATLTEISKTTGAEVPLVQGTYTAGTGVLNITLAQGEGRLFALPVGY
ncbi:hypothetical protein [Paenibacillus sp. PAMC21692]|uniref:hypothetical protein n=1 Tax=Paenibacillus sp. PAMC21692 TaxID=2762320 RepID=UPI00164E1E73|nr:hypothetical protein [Paenibacillus sp. PAMC21692]QNK58879.1 hypothetical protein H7F31_08425 [Paenibacillus sp. PAMC21692]